MKSITLLFFVALQASIQVFGCTNFIISKGASKDGSTMITYAADSHVLYGELYFWSAANYLPGDSLDIFEWDSGKYLGKIAQVDSTYKVVGNINEHQVAIGETTFTGRLELIDTTGIMDYGSLMYIALQRAKTAREAIQIMGNLVEEYGYYSSGESFSIADPNEVWILEMIGKGVGNKGAAWVAQRIPDGYISGHANQSRITTFPLKDPDNCIYSEDVIDFAKDKGYYTGKDKEFSFADAYAPIDFGGARFCEARVWSGFLRVNQNMQQYEDYAMGENLANRMPLWIKPENKLSAQDVMALMRNYYEGTRMDMTKDVGAGPYESIVRWRPLDWEIDGHTYFNERAISTQQTGFSFVAQCRSWLPNPVGGILWFGVDDTYSTVYVPLYCGIDKAPMPFAVGNGAMMEFSDSSAFWAFNQVSNYAYTRYNLMIPFIQEKQAEFENNYRTKTLLIDEQATALYNDSPEATTELLTTFSVTESENLLKEWKSLYRFLFTRFMDGNVKTAVEGAQNPDLEQPGYSEEWYRMIIEQTGDKFLYKGDASH